ncbi:MAG: hypothetical protein ACE5LC_01890 [Candidatus Aminicenantales bacterium]
MKKIVLISLILFLLLCIFVFGQENSAYQDYIKAMSAPSIQQKIQLLKDYLARYKGQGTEHENYVYAYLCLFSSQTNKLSEAVDYGETALTVGGLDDATRIQLYITLASIYTKMGKNLEKAKNYAMQAIDIARVNMSKESSTTPPTQWKQLMGAAYYTHAQAQEKAKQHKGAVSSYKKSYEILKNPQILKDLKKAGKALYDFKFYKEAEEAFQFASMYLRDFDSYAFYAKSLYKNGKKDDALTYFKKAYEKKKSGEIAYNIGIILAQDAKSDSSLTEEAIIYLLEASFLSPAHSQKAREYAESLFFNMPENREYNKLAKEIVDKNKKLEELIDIYNLKVEENEGKELTKKQQKILNDFAADIEKSQAEIEKLKEKQQKYVDAFNRLLEKAKSRLGIS